MIVFIRTHRTAVVDLSVPLSPDPFEPGWRSNAPGAPPVCSQGMRVSVRILEGYRIHGLDDTDLLRDIYARNPNHRRARYSRHRMEATFRK